MLARLALPRPKSEVRTDAKPTDAILLEDRTDPPP